MKRFLRRQFKDSHSRTITPRTVTSLTGPQRQSSLVITVDWCIETFILLIQCYRRFCQGARLLHSSLTELGFSVWGIVCREGQLSGCGYLCIVPLRLKPSGRLLIYDNRRHGTRSDCAPSDRYRRCQRQHPKTSVLHYNTAQYTGVSQARLHT